MFFIDDPHLFSKSSLTSKSVPSPIVGTTNHAHLGKKHCLQTNNHINPLVLLVFHFLINIIII